MKTRSGVPSSSNLVCAHECGCPFTCVCSSVRGLRVPMRERKCGCKQMWMPHRRKAATGDSEQVALKAAAKVPPPLWEPPHISPLSNNSSARAQLEIAVDTETERAFHCLGPHGLMALPRANTRSLCEFREEQAPLDRKFPKE